MFTVSVRSDGSESTRTFKGRKEQTPEEHTSHAHRAKTSLSLFACMSKNNGRYAVELGLGLDLQCLHACLKTTGGMP